MSQRKVNSRALRQIAAELLEDASQAGELSEAERDDLTTSLVRQWITYDGHATLFLGERQIYLHLGRSPLGRGTIAIESCPLDWTDVLREDWKISDDDLPDVLRQVNVGQSAEVVNQEGMPLRVWVNPKQRSNNVEPLAPQTRQPGEKRDDHKIACGLLSRLPGLGFDEAELDELACSVVKQWREYQGHACIFLDHERQAFFRQVEKEDGGCNTQHGVRPIDIKPLLTSLGCPEELLGEVLVRFNLGHKVEFKNTSGEPCVMWYDPRQCSVHVQHLDQPVARPKLASIFCPHCSAVLKVWSEGEQEQACPNCGRQVRHDARPFRESV